MGRHHTKTDIVVEVVEVVDVVVAVGTTRVPLIVVEGSAAKHTGVFGQPYHSKVIKPLYNTLCKIRRSQTACEQLVKFLKKISRLTAGNLSFHSNVEIKILESGFRDSENRDSKPFQERFGDATTRKPKLK